MLTLGIESSCDETSVALVRDGRDILTGLVSSQTKIHEKYGGVVPELACRSHCETVLPLLEECLQKTGVTLGQIQGVAAVNTPGLIGALLVGLSAGKALSFALNVPLIGVNHIEAHIYANFLLGEEVLLPAVALVVSGGHTSLFLYEDPLKPAREIGRTRDDAAGEAFDKIASIIGLPYPGGPNIEKAAKNGNPQAVRFPRTYLERDSFDFSFSGLKTAVLYHTRGHGKTRHDDWTCKESPEDVAASFQAAVVDVLVNKAILAAKKFQVKQILLAGGVAANTPLREALTQAARKNNLRFLCPPLHLCTDNAAMVAGLGGLRLMAGQRDNLHLDALPTVPR